MKKFITHLASQHYIYVHPNIAAHLHTYTDVT